MVTEAGSYLRLIDSCITQLKSPGPSRTCNESNEEEEKHSGAVAPTSFRGGLILHSVAVLNLYHGSRRRARPGALNLNNIADKVGIRLAQEEAVHTASMLILNFICKHV